MLPVSTIRLQAPSSRLHRWLAGAATLAFALLAPRAWAQDAGAPTTAVPATTSSPSSAVPGDTSASPVSFEADSVAYDYNNEFVTATGNVFLKHNDQSVRADKVVWNRKTGKIMATGNIRLVDENGNQLFTESMELTDELKAGTMANLLIALREGGRVAAETGTRLANGNIVLTKAAYSGCAVEDSDGCPKKPTWVIKAAQVEYDDQKHNLRFKNASMEFFGISLLPLPGLVLGTDGRPINGALIPDIAISPSNGVELSEGYYQRLGPSQDLMVTGYVFTKAAPMIAARYRALTDAGALQVTGYITRSSLIPVAGTAPTSSTEVRGYFAANGRFQFSPEWSLTSSIRYASDRTFLRRYDISRDDRLRSMIDLEHIDSNSYLSIAGWATETLRVGDIQGQVPIAVPLIDYRRRIANPVLGGHIELQLNTMAVTRTRGQDTQRAFAGVRWDLKRITPWGQEVTLTALARGDIYHSSENQLTATPSYRGLPGWQGRAVATAALDVKWPFVGKFLNGTQVLTPRFQVVASPTVRNLAIPNEDARAIDLEDSNLFALNRFPGYDRVEDDVRFTFGFDWLWQAPGWRINTTIGQSYRLSNKATLFPDGTGLNERVSDIVGRTEIRFKDIVKVTHRFRLDKDGLAIRRNEFDATVGSNRTYVEVGYLRLNRDITTVEDLQDREELRFSARVAVAKHWSIFGSGVINLTSPTINPLVNTSGWQPLRTRAGIAYDDDCLSIAVTWRRDFVATGDARRGNNVQIYFALRNIGFR